MQSSHFLGEFLTTHYYILFITIYCHKLYDTDYYMVKRDSLNHWASSSKVLQSRLLICKRHGLNTAAASATSGGFNTHLSPLRSSSGQERAVLGTWRSWTAGPEEISLREPLLFTHLKGYVDILRFKKIYPIYKDASGIFWLKVAKYEMLDATSVI